MSTEYRRHDSEPLPPAPDESYWQALLNEGEISSPIDLDGHDPYEVADGDEALQRRQNGHRATDEADWEQIRQVKKADEPIDLLIIGYNRGGLLVEWRTLQGFVPASQLLNFPVNASQNVRRGALVNRVGQTLKLRVIELDVEKNRLILSERAAQVKPGQRDALLRRLSAGDIVEGHVTNLCDFGAFVDLGGLEGLIHISELSWGRVSHPSTVLERDQQVRAYVLGVNPKEGRVALSLKRLRPDPWKTVEERYHIDQIVEGIITNVVDFGAFACIEEGLEGLIHVSELAEGQFLHPRNVIEEGERVRARILTINGPARRLGLSLRLVDE